MPGCQERYQSNKTGREYRLVFRNRSGVCLESVHGVRHSLSVTLATFAATFRRVSV